MEVDQISISPANRTGAASTGLILVLTSVLVVLVLFYLALVLRPDGQQPTLPIVRVYCAAGCAEPVELAIDAFNNTGGASVELARTAGSGELAGQIKTEFKTGLRGGADIFISADASLMEQAESAGVISSTMPIAIQKPVIAVAAGNAIKVTDLRTLVLRTDLRLGVGSENAAIGKLTRTIAQRDEILSELENRKRLDAENVMTLAQALVTGSLDAAVIWNTTVNQINRQNEKPALRIASLADSRNESQSCIALGIVSITHQRVAVEKFARFLTSPEIGERYFTPLGYDIARGDSTTPNQ